MRSYTNKKGEIITVGEEHLQTAVKIKKFLQKNNGRCSWAQHRKMMVAEGFVDSENSESYRQMIKTYQSSIGELPTATRHAEMVADSKLQSIQNLVGELSWEKREIQKALREFNKEKRDLIDEGLFIKEVRTEIYNVLSDVKWNEVLNHTFLPVTRSRNSSRMVLMLSDWHIGALVDIEGNKYNFDIAKERLDTIIDNAIQEATDNGVYRIDVVYCGDILEHAYMRDAQAYTAEFPVAKQMALGGRLMIKALYRLSQKFFTVYRGFAGNHDRFNKDKNGNIDGDTGMVVVNEMVQLFVEQADIENLVYTECQDYSARLINVNGRNFKFVHGDFEKANDFKKLAKHSMNDNIKYDLIGYGHFHHFMVLEIGQEKYEVRCGSLKGSDEYSEKNGFASVPSQVAIIVDNESRMYVKQLLAF